MGQETLLDRNFFKTLARWVNAVIVSSVCSLIGMSGAFYAYAESSNDCTLKDVEYWKDALYDSSEEATPHYRLSVTEDFIADCPYRHEIIEAHRIAGLAAVDGGYAKSAREHLESARSTYYTLNMREWSGLIAANLELGHTEAAWQERDSMVQHWINQLTEDGLADIREENVDGGKVYSVEFIALEPESYVRALWLAVPDGEGWPSAVVLRSDAFRNAMLRIRKPDAQRMEQIDLIGCRERITLFQEEGGISFETAKEAANAAAATYLQHPEVLFDNEVIDMDGACIWPDVMMPRPDPYEAVLID